MKNDPQAYAEPNEDWIEQQAICMKWLSILGVGFDPDLSADGYSPPFDNPTMEAEYTADMNHLRTLDGDLYDALYEAFAQWENSQKP